MCFAHVLCPLANQKTANNTNSPITNICARENRCKRESTQCACLSYISCYRAPASQITQKHNKTTNCAQFVARSPSDSSRANGRICCRRMTSGSHRECTTWYRLRRRRHCHGLCCAKQKQAATHGRDLVRHQ